jgi:hypothetical protein
MYPIESFWRSIKRCGDRVALASPIIFVVRHFHTQHRAVESLRIIGKEIR